MATRTDKTLVWSTNCNRCGFATMAVFKLGGDAIGYKCNNCLNFEQGAMYKSIEIQIPDTTKT